MDLYTVLLPPGDLVWADNEYMFVEYLAVMKRKKPYEDPMSWTSFLKCGSRIRQLEFTHPKPGKAEIAQLLVARNDGMTFLPSLQSVLWTEGPAVKGALLALASPSLECLRLDVWKGTPSSQVNHLLEHLSKPAPFIRNMAIDAFWPSSSILVTALLHHVHLHKLTLQGKIALTPTEFAKLVTLPRLIVLRVDLKEFDAPADALETHCLKELHCRGTCTELTSLVSNLNAPDLCGLDLQVDEHNSVYNPHTHGSLARAISRAVFASTLVSLRLGNGNTKDPPTWVSPSTSIPTIYLRDLFSPLIARIPQLRTLVIDFDRPFGVTDDDVLWLARAWPKLTSLTIDLFYMDAPRPSPPRLSSLALCHFAQSFPHLTFLKLRMEYAHPDPDPIPDLIACTPPQRERDHPLRVLGLDMFLPLEHEHRVELAQLITCLFPNLDVEACLYADHDRRVPGVWLDDAACLDAIILRFDWFDARRDVFDVVRAWKMLDTLFPPVQ